MLGWLLSGVLAWPTPQLSEATFVAVRPGVYTVGAVGHRRNPLRKVRLQAFSIGATEVTNAQFARFVKATGYRTDAEKHGFGMTFQSGMEDWQWASTPGAHWRRPFGPGQPDITGKDRHPVTQISFRDAQAYCRWAGGRLPSVEEWEVAARAERRAAGARAGVDLQNETPRWPWGEEFAPQGVYRVNTWQGPSHRRNTLQDGHLFTSPVASYPANSWGLYDVIGNVFEYCTDPRAKSATGAPLAAGRGGSWWCSPGTCDAFNLLDIGQMAPAATLPNQGFRMVKESDASP